VFTTFMTLSIVHCHPGFALVCGTGCACAASSDGARNARRSLMAAAVVASGGSVEVR
jgi:hypothetical protein